MLLMIQTDQAQRLCRQAETGNFNFVGYSSPAESDTQWERGAFQAPGGARVRVGAPFPSSRLRLSAQPRAAKLKAVQVHQVADEADAQGNAVRQQVHARLA